MTPTFDGTVVRKPFAQGSKSEHEAVVLATAEGDFVLRRQGGNPFADPVLDALVGKAVRCDGVLVGSTLVVTDWTETGQAPSEDASAAPTAGDPDQAGAQASSDPSTVDRAAAPPNGAGSEA